MQKFDRAEMLLSILRELVDEDRQRRNRRLVQDTEAETNRLIKQRLELKKGRTKGSRTYEDDLHLSFEMETPGGAA